MELLNELKSEFNTAIIMITHDLGVVAGSCDKVLVMYAGRTMEYGKVNEIFYQPSHPYTEGLLKLFHAWTRKERSCRPSPVTRQTYCGFPRVALTRTGVTGLQASVSKSLLY